MKQNLLDAAASAMKGVTSIDSANNGDKTGAPQDTIDAVNQMAKDNEAGIAGTLTAMANYLTDLAATIPDGV